MKLIYYFRFKTVKIGFLILVTAVLALFCNCEGVFAQSLTGEKLWSLIGESNIEMMMFFNDGTFAYRNIEGEDFKATDSYGTYQKTDKILTIHFKDDPSQSGVPFEFSWINEEKFSLKFKDSNLIFSLYVFSSKEVEQFVKQEVKQIVKQEVKQVAKKPSNNVNRGQYENINPTYPAPVPNPFITPDYPAPVPNPFITPTYPPPTNPFSTPVVTPSTPQTQKSEVCYTCHGTGSCNVCKGTGEYSLYGNPSSPCSACGGTGKCWHCHGSRKQ